MNSVDRATLIDFALGRLDDAEAAALANRAERDSEFAQTLAALRRELASLDAVCPSALRALPLRSPLLDAVETSLPSQTPLPGDDDAQNVVIFDAPLPNAVKVRRVGPVYPFYGDEDRENTQNEQLSENKQGKEYEQNAQNERLSKNKQDEEDGQNAQNERLSENKQDEEDGQNAQNERLSENKQDKEDGQNTQNERSSENEQDEEDEQNAQNERLSENKQNEEDALNNQDKQVSEDEQDDEDEQSVQNKRLSENKQDAQEKQTSEGNPNSQDGRLSENKQDNLSEQFAESGETARPLRRFNFIPKFIAAPRADQGSAFVAKRARFLNDAQEGAPRSDEFQRVAPLAGAGAESTPENEPETSKKNDYRNDADKNVADFEISNGEQTDALQDAQVDDAPLQSDETPKLNVLQETANDAESTRENEPETSEKNDYRNDADKNVADFEISNGEQTDALQDAQVDDAVLQSDETSKLNVLQETANDAESTRENEPETSEKNDYRSDADKNVANFEISNGEQTDALQDAQVDDATLQNDETSKLNVLQETANDAESTRENEPETSEKNDYRNDADKNVADFEISNGEQTDALQEAQIGDATLQNAENTFSNAERRLVELLGREPTPAERDEYYWEPVDEETEEFNDEFQPKKRRSLLGAPTRFATETTIAIGRTTLALCGCERRVALGSDAFAATKARRKRQPGKISDMMISTVSGLLIAVVVVWPLLCLAAKEVLATIALSAVRKIGVNVQISESAPQQDVLPLITEYIVFPRSSESAALQSLDAAPTQETGARFETPTLEDVPVVAPVAPVAPVVDPASTPPTLVPAPAAPDEAYNAPLDDAEESPSEAPFPLNDL